MSDANESPRQTREPTLEEIRAIRAQVEARVKAEEEAIAEEEKHKAAAKPSNKPPYLYVTDRGRIQVNPSLLAQHLRKVFQPIYFEGGRARDLRHYESTTGLWPVLPESEVRQRCVLDLGALAGSNKISDAVQCLKDLVYAPPETVEPAPMMLNVRNGMIDLEARLKFLGDPTRWFLPHDPKYFSRVQLPVSYRPDLGDPRLWLQALNEIFADNLDKVNVLWQFAGYCLYPRILFPCALFQIGGGGNGKGTVEDVLCAMVGQENVSHISLERLQDRFGAVELKDKLLNACGETDSGILDLTRFKAVVSGDEIHAEVKYAGDVKFRPIAKHLISMNAKPSLRERSNSLFRRVIPLEFCQQFGGDGGRPLRNRIQDEIIATELDAVFGWALEALDLVLAQGKIDVPESLAMDVRAFKAAMNPLVEFANEACLLDPKATVRPPDLYRIYQAWSKDGGMRPLGKNKFYELVKLHFPAVRRTRPQVGPNQQATYEVFEGIGILTDLPFLDGAT